MPTTAYLMGWEDEAGEQRFFSDYSINSKILSLMEHKDYSLQLMATFTHTPIDELHDYIYNTHNADFSSNDPLLIKIAEVLGVDVQIFFDYFYFTDDTFENYFMFLSKKRSDNVPLTDLENMILAKHENQYPDPSVTEDVLRKYIQIDHHGHELINLIIEKEYARCMAGGRVHHPNDDKDIFDEPLHLRAVPDGFIEWIHDKNLHPAIKMIKDRFPEADYAYQVPDDSMFPIYAKGDVVFIHAQDTVDEGEYGLFIVQEECMLRRRGVNDLIPENLDYDCLGGFADVFVVGKVIAALKMK